MKKHTKEFKSSISTFGRELDSKITVLGTELILEKEDLFSITPITNSALLKTVMKEVDFESKKQIGIGQEINVKSGVKVGNEYEYIDYGNYSVYKSEYKAETDTYSHICYDKMLKTMIDYTPLDITYPINLREYINAIATKCGLEFADKNSTFANYNTLINEDHFSNGNYTFRDVLDYIAQLVGGWFCINDNDELEIRYPELARNYDKVSGENVSFISNVEDEINTIIVDGKSTQETRSGKNLLKNIGVSNTSNGITFTVNDDKTILANGNNDGTANSRFIINNYSLKAGTYILNGCPSGGSSTTYRLAIQKTSDWSILGLDTGSGSKQFTIDEATNIQVGIFIQKGQTISNLLFKPMIRLSSIIDDTYEQYGVMPSPDYPSEVECVRGKNLFDGIFELGLIDGVTGQNLANNNYIRSKNYIPVEELTDYKFSSIDYTGSVYVCEYKADFSYNLTINKQINLSNYFTTNKDTKYIRFRPASATTNLDLKFQLEKGTVATNYLPYDIIQVKDVGKNLYKYGDISDNVSSVYYVNHKLLDNFENNTTYTISFDITSSVQPFRIIIGYGDDAFQKEMINGTLPNVNNGHISFTFTTDDTTYSNLWIRAPRYTTPTTYTTTISNIMLEKGTQATTYELYQENTININLQGNELCSLPNNVKDELVIENGRAKIIKRVGKVVLNGDEAFSQDRELTNSFRYYTANFINGVNNISLSNYFVNSTIGNINSVDEQALTVINSKQLVMRVNKSIATTVVEFKTWLSTHNTTVYYELETPTEIDLGEVETLSTFKGINNVSLEANMQTNMSLTYTAEYEELDKHFLKDVNVSFTKKYGAVNSVVFSRGNGSDNIYRKDNMSISKNGLTEIKIADNPFLEGNDRENFIQQLFDKINGLEFYIMDVASTGIMYLELGNLYYFNMIEEKPSLKSGLVKSGMRKAQGSSGGKFLCLLMNDEIKITQGLEESIYSDEPEITETNYKTASITDASIKNAIIQTNKNSAEILLKVNSNKVVSAINLSPENIKISSAKLDIDAIATFTNSKLAVAGSTVINGANITTGSINCDRLNGGTINGQKISGSTISGGSISIEKSGYYFNMGTSTSNPNCSGLNVGEFGIKAYSDITATGFAITDSDTGKSQSINIYDGHSHVHYLTFSGGILTKWEYK